MHGDETVWMAIVIEVLAVAAALAFAALRVG
jgi:hypothetical protein